MKLTTFIMFIFLAQVSANGFGQKINLNVHDIPITQVIKLIEKQSGYVFLFDTKDLKDKNVSIQVTNATIERTITAFLKDDVFSYKLIGKNIIVQKKERNIADKISEVFQKDSVNYTGTVLDETGKPMSGATVRIKGENRVAKTTTEGNFVIYGPKKGAIQISYLGYVTKEVTLTGLNPKQLIRISLVPGTNNLGEIDIVSTGYQNLPKERATGSFEVVTKEQLQHSTAPNLIQRLEGITTSMNFNHQLTPTNSVSNAGIATDVISRSPLATLTIRGANTLVRNNTIDNFSGQPLVVIDGIASAYSVDAINPDDVENITILKDAAAASIWGSRAANGVIVIKTKRGDYNKPVNIFFNSNVSVTDKFNLFYKKYISTSDFIDAQILQFNTANTTYNPPTDLTQGQPVLSPVAEILNQQKLGQITDTQAKAKLDALRGNDVRKDLDKYILRKAVTQSYALSIDGGSKNLTYRLSGSYNKTLNNTVHSDQDRLSLTYNTSFRPLKNLEVQANVTYNRQRDNNQAGQNLVTAGRQVSTYYPYTRLADDNGNPLPITYHYRPAFLDSLAAHYGSNIQNMQFTPLDDINQGYTKINTQGINLNLSATYKISPVFSANVLYNNYFGYDQINTLYGQNSFYMRELTNFFTAAPDFVDPLFGPQPFRKNIPLGDLYLPRVTKSNNRTLRGQLNVNKTWNEKHVLSAIAGIDIAQSYSWANSNQYYGYDSNTLTNKSNINYYDYILTLFGDASTGQQYLHIPYIATGIRDYRVRTYSLFSNAAYTYNNRYTLSASIRKDASSEFGQGTNKGGTPYYSIGTSWNIANEDFYKIDWLPRLQLRTTFGYNGNVNPQVTARPILTYQQDADPTTGFPYAATGSDVSNKKLRPEKTAVLNFGLDFGLRNNRLSGSLEYYDKKTTDLLTSGQVDPTTGFSSIVFNTATLHGWGTDLTLNSQNLKSGMFSWTSNFLFSYNRQKITKLFSNRPNTAIQLIAGVPNYNEGSDLFRLFAYKWAGLDPTTGDPRGYLNGQSVSISPNAQGGAALSAIDAAPGSTARYFGSSVPVYFGSFRNTFNYGMFSISANLLYKLGYYFRKPTSSIVSYAQLFNVNILQSIEYTQRWQHPGDELHTNVPSLTTASNTQFRDNFYYYSEVNVLKADQIRLQEINLSYGFNKKNWFIKNPRIYANFSNLGVIWRANKQGLDPDANDYPQPRTYTLGLSANF